MPGPIALLGSGETLPSSGKVHDWIAARLPPRPSIAVLETPAGFEPNSDLVAGKIKGFLDHRLQNVRPNTTVVAARGRGTPHSPDDMEVVAPLLDADEILLGPGSPTYCVRQLRGSLAWHMILARVQRGAAVFLSSAATLACGAFTLPVYEIYKVGEDLHWKVGLDLFALFGLALTVVPHWDNTDGGDELDTSRCYMGQARFDRLVDMLPRDQLVLGIDEHTGFILDPSEGVGHVLGNGTVTLLGRGEATRVASGGRVELAALGDWRAPVPSEGVPEAVWAAALRAEAERAEREAQADVPPAEARDLLRARDAARSAEQWDRADALRDRLLAWGWEVRDTPDGSELVPVRDGRRR